MKKDVIAEIENTLAREEGPHGQRVELDLRFGIKEVEDLLRVAERSTAENIEDRKHLVAFLKETREVLLRLANRESAVEVKNWPEAVTVENMVEVPPFPKTVNVGNLPKPQKDVEIRRSPWLENALHKAMKQSLTELLEELTNLKRGIPADLERYRDANKPIAVRLSNGRKFYEAIMQAISSGGYGGGSSSSLSATVSTGQVKVAVTGTAVQFPTRATTNGLIITANADNAAKVTVGGSTVTNTVDGAGNGYVLDAGGSTSAAVSNANVLYLNGTSSDWVSFIVS